MYYKHYVIVTNRNNEFIESIFIAFTASVEQAKQLHYILQNYYGLKEHLEDYKYNVGYSPVNM